jgi:hypothetical protein
VIPWPRAIALGVLIGLVYTLSPMLVWFVVAAGLLYRLAVRELGETERRWITAMLLVAIAIRVAAVLGLVVMTDHHQTPFGSFFGDEEYFIRRAWWLRNVALGIPIHRADLIYAFDDYSYTIYLYVLAGLHVLMGPSPYGVHFFGIAAYLAATVILYRIARRRFGPLPASIGLGLLLFLPSLLAWSVSALKEPLAFLLAALGVWAGDVAFRGGSTTRRGLALAALVALAFVLESMRAGGFAMLLVGVVGGGLLALIVQRPRVAVACLVLAPAIVATLMSRPEVQIRFSRTVQQLAGVHWGHVNTPGYSYKLLDDRVYEGRFDVDTMSLQEEMRFIGRALIAYVVTPTPWSIQSRAALAYLPEQMIWYLMVVLVPIGVIGGLRRDVALTCMLLALGVIAAAMVALTGGNVGTLVRHRGLAIPYLVWLVGVGLPTAVTWLSVPRERVHEPHDVGDVHPEVAWR